MRYIVLFLAIALWAGGCSRSVMKWFYQTNVIADDYRYGDLYRLSNLPQFKDPQTPCRESETLSNNATNTHLYLIGDSFTEPQRIDQRDFPVSNYQYVHWDNRKEVQLDTTKRNILLLETVERHFREHFSRPVAELTVVSDTTKRVAPEPVAWKRQLFDQIQSKGIEERLETVLFSQDFFLWFKELKASINFNWFDRVPPTVGISHDRQHLFVDLDTDTTKRQRVVIDADTDTTVNLNSSFTPLSDQEVSALVDSVNATADQFRKRGFDAVYLSIIPNKASILDPGQGPYNHLIERIQKHPRLRVPFADVYSVYAKQPKQVYALGDSHWNCTGRALWLKSVKELF